MATESLEWSPDTAPGYVMVDDEERILIGAASGDVAVTDAEGEFITEWQVPRCTIGGLLVTEVEVVVADTRGHRLIFYAFSPKRYRRPQRDLIVGEDGPSDFPGQFNTPSGLARMSNGNIVVADRGNNRVQVLSDEGEFLDEFGERGDGDGELQFPIDVSVDSADNIYVCDSGNHRVCVFSASGDFLRHIGGYGTGNGQLSAPVGVLVIESAAEGRDEELVVADSGNNRVQVFSTKGSFLWYTEDDGEDKFSRPRFLGVAKDGDILVADDTRAVWFAPAGDDAGGGDEEKEVDAADEAAVDVGEGDEEGQSGSDVGASVKGGSESDGGEEDDAADGADGSDVAEHGESAESAPPSPERRPGRSPGRAPPVSPISSPGKGESRAEDPAGFALSPETPAQPSAAHELDMSATPAGGSDDDDGVDFNTTMRPGTIRRELALDAVSSDSGGDHDSDSDDSGADQSRLSGEGGGEGGREGSGGSDAEETQAGAAASIDASQSKRVVKKRRASRSATHGRTPRAGKEPEFVAAREDMEAELQELRREYGRIELERKAAKDRVSELKELTTRVQKELRKYGAKLLAQQAATAPPVQVRAVDRKYPLRGDAPPNYEKCRDPIFLEERILDLHVHLKELRKSRGRSSKATSVSRSLAKNQQKLSKLRAALEKLPARLARSLPEVQSELSQLRKEQEERERSLSSMRLDLDARARRTDEERRQLEEELVEITDELIAVREDTHRLERAEKIERSRIESLERQRSEMFDKLADVS